MKTGTVLSATAVTGVVALVAGYFLFRAWEDRMPAGAGAFQRTPSGAEDEEEEEMVDETIEASFPASDPPSYSPTRAGGPGPGGKPGE